MKSRLVMILIFITTIQLFSSSIQEKGFKGGINFSNLNLDGTMGGSQVKFTLGSYSTYKSKSIMAIQAEGYVAGKGADVGSNSIDLIYLEIDYLARFDIYKRNELFPYILLGPYMGIKVRSVRNDGDHYYSYDPDLNEIIEHDNKIKNLRLLDFGGVAALGLKFDKFSIEYRYTYGFTSIAKNDINIKNSYGSIIIGYEFKKNTY